MYIDHATRILTLEPNANRCTRCWGSGSVPSTYPCPTGGRGPRGGVGGCRQCHGMMRHVDHDVRETCGKCHNVNPQACEDETLYDTVHLDLLADLVEWRVVDATNTRFTEVGACIGARGSIVTTVDYGAHKRLTDDELVAEVRDRNHSTQGVFVVRDEDMRIADAIAVVRRANGYNVIAVWDDAATAAA